MPAKKQKRQSKENKKPVVVVPVKPENKPKEQALNAFVPPYGAWSAES